MSSQEHDGAGRAPEAIARVIAGSIGQPWCENAGVPTETGLYASGAGSGSGCVDRFGDSSMIVSSE